MREIHGVCDVRKLAVLNGDDQRISVEDGPGYVILRLAHCSFPAGPTPQEARFIAAQLIASAERVEAAASTVVKEV